MHKQPLIKKQINTSFHPAFCGNITPHPSLTAHSNPLPFFLFDRTHFGDFVSSFNCPTKKRAREVSTQSVYLPGYEYVSSLLFSLSLTGHAERDYFSVGSERCASSLRHSFARKNHVLSPHSTNPCVGECGASVLSVKKVILPYRESVQVRSCLNFKRFLSSQ